MSKGHQTVTRVAMVSASFHPDIGGSERQALEVSRVLVRRGVAVTVLTRRLQGLRRLDAIDGVEIRRLFRAGRGLLDSVSFLLSLFGHLLLHGRRYNVIHVQMASSPAIAAAWAGALRRLPVFVKIAGGAGFGEIALGRRSFLGKWKLAALKHAKVRFLVVSPSQATEVRASGLCPEPIELPNGVDVTRFHRAAEGRGPRLSARCGNQDPRPVFLAVTRLDEEKSQAASALVSFFEGWRTARLAGMEAELWIAGGGPAAERLRIRATDFGLNDSVRWLGWVEDPAPLYQAADVFVLVSRAEGLSNAMLEAMASGLPVCATRVPGIIERIQPGIHGLLFDPDSPDEAARAVSSAAWSRCWSCPRCWYWCRFSIPPLLP